MMKNKKISLIIGISVCALVIVLTIVYAVITGTSVSAKKTSPPCDIENSYAKDAILMLLDRELLSTENVDGKVYFYPEKEVSRSEIATVLTNYLNIDTAAFEKTALGFADEAQIAEKDLAKIRAVLSQGYIKLKSDYTFSPSAPITREEAADIFSGLCKFSVSAGKSERFSDFEEISAHFESGARKAVDLDLMIGYPDDTFRPKNNLTREELATILHRLITQDAEAP